MRLNFLISLCKIKTSSISNTFVRVSNHELFARTIKFTRKNVKRRNYITAQLLKLKITVYSLSRFASNWSKLHVNINLHQQALLQADNLFWTAKCATEMERRQNSISRHLHECIAISSVPLVFLCVLESVCANTWKFIGSLFVETHNSVHVCALWIRFEWYIPSVYIVSIFHLFHFAIISRQISIFEWKVVRTENIILFYFILIMWQSVGTIKHANSMRHV